MERDEDEIREVIDRAAASIETGTRWPGMNYEEGVRAALEWALGDVSVDENPMGDY